jgi:uncharacterized membrane protein YqgA involved in biofilm formation
MELFRGNNKVDKFLKMKGDVIHAYFNITSLLLKSNLRAIGSLNNGLSGKSTTINDSTQCINAVILCPGNDIDPNNENLTDKLK